MSSHRRVPLTLTSAGALCAGTLASALTTSESQWWALYFSRLGMTDDASSLIFNAGMIGAGMLVIAAAVMMRLWLLHPLVGADPGHRRAATFMPVLVATLGLSLAAIGMIPLSLNEYLHQRAADGVICAFACLLLAHRAFLRKVSRALNSLALGAAAVLITGMAAMSVEAINLTVFEALAFTAILTWVHALETHLRRAAHPLERGHSANSQRISLSPIWGTRHLALSSLE